MRRRRLRGEAWRAAWQCRKDDDGRLRGRSSAPHVWSEQRWCSQAANSSHPCCSRKQRRKDGTLVRDELRILCRGRPAAQATDNHAPMSGTPPNAASIASPLPELRVPLPHCLVFHALDGKILPGCAAAARDCRAREDETARIVTAHERAHWRIRAAEPHVSVLTSCKLKCGFLFPFHRFDGVGLY